jgi:hypothetical protein
MDGKRVLAGFSILLCFLVLFMSTSQAQQMREVFITSMGWNGNYWLIGGFYSSREEGVRQFLVKFDGEGFFDPVQGVELRIPELTLESLAWNGRYWLLSYNFEDIGELIKFDGRRFYIVGLPESGRVDGFDWNGKYWLIGGDGYLVKYDGGNVTDLTADFTESTGLDGATSVLWLNGTWLIMGVKEKAGEYYPTATWRLVAYDGVNFHTLEKQSAIGWFRRSSWNGEYLLLVFRDNLARYDGRGILNLTAEAGFNDRVITTLDWNGRYWLIGANDGTLKEYDGTSFKNIKGLLLKMIKAVKWGDNYWLIAGRGEDGLQKLFIYDGAVFKNITPEFKKALGYGKSTSTQIHKEPTLPEPQRGVCAPTLIILLTLLPALFHRLYLRHVE